MSLKLYRPTRDGLEQRPVEARNWRAQLRSRRWRAPPLENSEKNPPSALVGVLFFGGMAFLTFVLLLLGYGTRFWGS